MRLTLTTSALAAFLAAPAYAQDAPICGGISLVGEWVGGDEAGSDALGPEAFFDLTGEVPIAGHLVRMFTVSQPGAVRIDVAAIPAGDPYIALYDASGTEVAADDDGGGDFSSRLVADLAPGTYCLAARSYESGVTDVSIQIGRPSFFPETDNGLTTPPSSSPIGSGAGCGSPEVAIFADGQVSGAMLQTGTSVTATTGQNPAYEFNLTDDVPLSITAVSDLGDPLIRLKDASGSVIAENDDFEGLNSRIDLIAPLAAGTYCVEVEDLNGASNDITVELVAFDPVADRQRRLGLMEFAPLGTDEVTITDLGALSTLISTDVTGSAEASWYSLSVPEGGLLLIEAIGTDVDPELKLFDRAGREVAYNDDGPDGLDSLIVYRAQPGNYTLGLRTLDDGSRGNVRIFAERYVPAQ